MCARACALQRHASGTVHRATCTLRISLTFPSSCCALPCSAHRVCLPPCAQRPDAAPARLLRAPAACASGSLLCFVCFCRCWSCRCRCWLVPLLLLLSNSACSRQQQRFLFCFQREDRLLQARGFHQRVQLPTHAKNLVGTSPPASALSLSALAPTRACARCMSVRHLLFPFSFSRRSAHNTRSTRTRTLSRAGCQRFRAPAAAHCDLCIGACCLARACGAHRCPFFLCCARSPSPFRAAPRGPLSARRRRCCCCWPPPHPPPCARALPRPPLPAQLTLPVFFGERRAAPAAPHRAAVPACCRRCEHSKARLPSRVRCSHAQLRWCWRWPRALFPCVRCPPRTCAFLARLLSRALCLCQRHAAHPLPIATPRRECAEFAAWPSTWQRPF